MRRWVVLGALALTLAGCGGGRGEEDFAVTVQKPVAGVYTAIGTATMPSEIRALFPQLKVERTRPSDDEVLYTIPGDGDFPATIRFRFDAVDGGKATTIHAFIDVPATKVSVEGMTMRLSETKVERELSRYFERVAKGGGDWGSSPLPETLIGLAVATNSKALAEFQEMQKNPEKYAGRLAGLGAMFDDESSDGVGMPGDGAEPMADPDRAASGARPTVDLGKDRDDDTRSAASAPMSDVEGADVGPSAL